MKESGARWLHDNERLRCAGRSEHSSENGAGAVEEDGRYRNPKDCLNGTLTVLRLRDKWIAEEQILREQKISIGTLEARSKSIN